MWKIFYQNNVQHREDKLTTKKPPKVIGGSLSLERLILVWNNLSFFGRLFLKVRALLQTSADR